MIPFKEYFLGDQNLNIEFHVGDIFDYYKEWYLILIYSNNA